MLVLFLILLCFLGALLGGVFCCLASWVSWGEGEAEGEDEGKDEGEADGEGGYSKLGNTSAAASLTGTTFGCLSAVEAILVSPKPNVTPKIATPALIKALGEGTFLNQGSFAWVLASSGFSFADLT